MSICAPVPVSVSIIVSLSMSVSASCLFFCVCVSVSMSVPVSVSVSIFVSVSVPVSLPMCIHLSSCQFVIVAYMCVHNIHRSLSAKEPIITGLFCGKRPIKLRHPMPLCHPVYVTCGEQVWAGMCDSEKYIGCQIFARVLSSFMSCICT